MQKKKTPKHEQFHLGGKKKKEDDYVDNKIKIS